MQLLGRDAARQVLEPRAEIIWCLPFWIRAMPLPIDFPDRVDTLQRVCNEMNRELEKLGKDRPPVRNFRVKSMEWPAEPAGIVTRLGARIIADIDDNPWAEMFHRWAADDRYGGAISIHEGAPFYGSTLRIEEFGMGTVEYSCEVAADNIEAFLDFMEDSESWQDRQYINVEYAKMPIQTAWPTLRAAMQRVVDGLSMQFNDLEDLFVPLPGRPDDICRSGYCWDIVLFRSGEIASDDLPPEDRMTAHEAVQHIVQHIERRREPQWTLDLFMPTDFGALDVLCSGFTSVALVSEASDIRLVSPEDTPANGDEVPSINSDCISLRLRALWRQNYLNYAILAEAALGMQVKLSRFIRMRPKELGWSQTQAQHESFRRVTAALSMIAFGAQPKSELGRCCRGESIRSSVRGLGYRRQTG